MQLGNPNHQSPPGEIANGFHRFKEPFLMVFHAVVVITYGYAIYVINQPSGRKTDSLLEPYGKWRFLTYNDIVLQFVTYSVCLVTHIVPKLTKWRDFLFTTLALPIGTFVVITFWAVWHTLGRENILPVESGCPDWLNHISHTIMGPINLIQLALVRHEYLSDKKAIASLFAFLMTYNSYLLYIRFQTGKFVYIFMNKMSPLLVVIFIICMLSFTVFLYKVGKFVHDYVHVGDEQIDRVVIIRADYRPSDDATNIPGSKGSNPDGGVILRIIES